MKCSTSLGTTCLIFALRKKESDVPFQHGFKPQTARQPCTNRNGSARKNIATTLKPIRRSYPMLPEDSMTSCKPDMWARKQLLPATQLDQRRACLPRRPWTKAIMSMEDTSFNLSNCSQKKQLAETEGKGLQGIQSYDMTHTHSFLITTLPYKSQKSKI